jgi:hypothetical protein
MTDGHAGIDRVGEMPACSSAAVRTANTLIRSAARRNGNFSGRTNSAIPNSTDATHACVSGSFRSTIVYSPDAPLRSNSESENLPFIAGTWLYIKKGSPKNKRESKGEVCYHTYSARKVILVASDNCRCADWKSARA